MPEGAPLFPGAPATAFELDASLLTPHEAPVVLPTQSLMVGRWFTGGESGVAKRTGAQLGYHALLTKADPADDEWHRVTSVGPSPRDKTLADTGLRGIGARPQLVWQTNQTHAKGEVDATRGAGGPQTVRPGEMIDVVVEVYEGAALVDSLTRATPQEVTAGAVDVDAAFRPVLYDANRERAGYYCPITKAIWIEPPEAYEPGATFEATPTIRPYPSAPVDATADVLAALAAHDDVLHPPGDGCLWISDAAFRPPSGSKYWMRDVFQGYEPFTYSTEGGSTFSVQLPRFLRSSVLGILVTDPLREPDKDTGYLQGINGADVPQSNGLGIGSQQGMEFHNGTILGPLPYLDWYRWRTDPGGASHALHPAAVDDFKLRGCEVAWGFDDALKLGRQEQKGPPLTGQAVLSGDQPAATAAGFPMSEAAPAGAQVFHCAVFPVEEGQNKIGLPSPTPRWRLRVGDGPNAGRVIFAANAVNEDDSLAVLSWEDTPFTNRDEDDFPDDPGADVGRILGYLDTTFNTWYLASGVDVGAAPVVDCREVDVASNANPGLEGNWFTRSGRNGTTPGSHTGTMLFNRNAVLGNSVLGLGIGLAGAFAGDLNMAPQRNDIEKFGQVLGTGNVAVGELDSVMKGIPAQEEGMPYIGAQNSVMEDLYVFGGRDKGIKTNGDRLGPVTYRRGASGDSQNAMSWDHSLGGVIEDRAFVDNVIDALFSARCAGVVFRRNRRERWQERRGYVVCKGRTAVFHSNVGFHIEVGAPTGGETVEVYDNLNCTYDLAAGVVFEGEVLTQPYVTGSAPV